MTIGSKHTQTWLRRLRNFANPLQHGSPNSSKWENRWKVESQRPITDLATAVPLELKESVATGWLAAGSSVMDIGSGSGQITAWLAQQGFRAVGVDISQTATNLARIRFGSLRRDVEFRTLNIVEDQPKSGQFDAFVDRGCFHSGGIDRARYVQNVATWGRPGARLLLFHKIKPGHGTSEKTPAHHQREIEDRVREAFETHFIVERTAMAAEPLVKSTGRIPRAVLPGMVFWITKR